MFSLGQTKALDNHSIIFHTAKLLQSTTRQAIWLVCKNCQEVAEDEWVERRRLFNETKLAGSTSVCPAVFVTLWSCSATQRSGHRDLFSVCNCYLDLIFSGEMEQTECHCREVFFKMTTCLQESWAVAWMKALPWGVMCWHRNAELNSSSVALSCVESGKVSSTEGSFGLKSTLFHFAFYISKTGHSAMSIYAPCSYLENQRWLSSSEAPVDSTYHCTLTSLIKPNEQRSTLIRDYQLPNCTGNH